MIRAQYLVDAIGLNKVQGLPFMVREIIAAVDQQLDTVVASPAASTQPTVTA